MTNPDNSARADNSTQHSKLENQVKPGHDHVIASQWTPPQNGTVPHIRVGKRWFNVFWLVPLAFGGLIVGIAVGRELRGLPFIEEFIQRYPGHTSDPISYQGFPDWLRIQHFANIILMMFIIRSGIQILADHPRLYLDKNSTPGSEWFRFQHEVPKDRLWVAKDDAVTLPGWIGLPGIRHSIGLARWWHFSCDMLWMLNGIVFYVLLFTTHQWERLIPTSWEVIPNALSMMLQYLSLQMPPENGWIRYNSLQQIAYFITVFVAAPLAIFTGLMQAPAIANSFGFLGKLFNRQFSRTIHFLIMLWFVQFLVVHVTMVFVTGVRRNLNHITIGTDTLDFTGLLIAAIALTGLAIVWFRATPFTLNNSRLVQRVGEIMLGGLKGWMENLDPKTQYSDKDIAPFLWPNGLVPTSEEFKELFGNNFLNYKLTVEGLVERRTEFPIAELHAMPRQVQTTAHYCIQGWSGVAKWAGVPVRNIMDVVGVKPEAKYAVFFSFGEGGEGGIYYDVHSIENMRHELTILAYEMNGSPLPLLYGAPLRLRCENELGFKQVKWIRAIEFVEDFKKIGSGHGGYNEDHEFYGHKMPI